MRNQIRVSRNHLILNIFISLLLFAVLCLPYYCPWYRESSTFGNGDNLHFALTHVWMPVKATSIEVDDAGKEVTVETVEHEYISMAHFIHLGCPSAILPPNKTCRSYSSFQFAALGYFPIKFASQLIHALNIFNAIRVLGALTKSSALKQAERYWKLQERCSIFRLVGIDCNKRSQRIKI